MGIFSRKRNWAVGAIEPPSHNRNSYPDLRGIAIDITGGDNEAAEELLNRWHMALVHHAHTNLRNVGLSNHYADLDAVVKRPDCDTEMLYNLLLNLGGGGRAIAVDWRKIIFDTAIPAGRQEMSVDDGRHTQHEIQGQPTEEQELAVPTVETFDRQLIKRVLENIDGNSLEGIVKNYVTDEDGDFVLETTATPESKATEVILAATGEQNNIYQIYSKSTVRLSEKTVIKVYVFCNEWNTEKLWPTAFVRPMETDADTISVQLVTRCQISCEKGIHFELLEDFTENALLFTVLFWENANQILQS